MLGRRRTVQEGGEHLAIRTDIREKGGNSGDEGAGETVTYSRTASTHSVATSTEEQVNTMLSASSAGNTSSLSSSEVSANSTARTSTLSNGDDNDMENTTSSQLRPTITVLDLVSTSASSSALPEGFGFSVSRKGTFIAVSSSSNIWLINAATLPRLFTRSLEVRRKPLALDILDDGSLLAVLSKSTQVDLYKLNSQDEGKIEKQSTLMLENEANTLALSPDGLILVTGHSYGIEIFSLSPTAPDGCRRTAACSPMDRLEFSDDGRTLLCTSYAWRRSLGSTLFSVNGPYDGPFTEEGVPIQQDVDKAWTSQILFPEKVPRACQATLRPDPGTGQVNEIFALDAREHTWGIYDIAAQEFTNKTLLIPEQKTSRRPVWAPETLGETVPAVSQKGNYVALGLGTHSSNLRLWGIEEDAHDQTCQCQGRDPVCVRNARYDRDPNLPCDPCFSLPVLDSNRFRCQLMKILRWVEVPEMPNVQRLIAVGNVTEGSNHPDVPALAQSSTGVVVVMDFDKGKNGKNIPLKTTYDLDNILPGERLPEEDIDFEREVELVRTRTVVQRRAADRASDGRRASRVGSRRPQTAGSRAADRRSSIPVDEETLAPEEAQALFEAPYDHSQPRSQTSLSRAATVAAASPANRRHLRALPFRPLEYRRADGLRELPHESDADNWVPPPPPYTPNIDPKTSLPFPQASSGNSSRTPNRSASASLASGSTVPNSSLAQLQSDAGSRLSNDIPPVPPLPSIPSTGFNNLLRPGPYPTGSSMHSQSASDLTLSAPPTRPSLLHPLTYPSPSSGRRRSSAASPQGSISNHNFTPADSGRQHSTDQQSAYQATTTVRSRNFVRQDPVIRPSRHTTLDPINTTFPTNDSRSSLRPPISFSNPFSSNLRRGSAPDIATHTRRRPVPGSEDQSRSPLARPESRPGALRHSMLPRISTRSGAPVNQLGPMSAPPMTNNRRHQQGVSPGPGRNEDREKHKSPGRKRLACIVM